MRVSIVEPYHSHAMRRPAEVIAQSLSRLGAKVSIDDKPDLSADIMYHCPWHTLVARERGDAAKHVMLYTHCNPGMEDDLLEACKNANAVVAMSFAGRKELIDLGVTPEKLIVIPMGTDGFTPRKIKVGVVGAVQPNGRKREHLLTDMSWLEDLSAYHFMIVGKGWEPTVKTLQNNGVSVTYSPELSDADMRYFYQQIDVLVVTGYLEGGPMPLLEALASGTPVLTPRFGYAADISLGYQNYYLNAAELLRHLNRQFANPQRDRVEIASMYRWADFAEEHVALFERLTGEVLAEKSAELERPLRYAQLLEQIDRVKPKVLVEVGTHRGDRAIAMIQAAAKWHPMEQITYYGFDLWEELTAGKLRQEFSKQPPSVMAVQRRLTTTGATISLIQGDTKLTLKDFKLTADFVFIDGGHSDATIRSDWKNIQRSMGPNTVVIFDDWYSAGAPEGVGCQALISELWSSDVYEVDPLPRMDRFQKPWGTLEVSMMMVRQAPQRSVLASLPPMPFTTTATTNGTISFTQMARNYLDKEGEKP